MGEASRRALGPTLVKRRLRRRLPSTFAEPWSSLTMETLYEILIPQYGGFQYRLQYQSKARYDLIINIGKQIVRSINCSFRWGIFYFVFDIYNCLTETFFVLLHFYSTNLLGKSSQRLSLAGSRDNRQTDINTNKRDYPQDSETEYLASPEVLEDLGKLVNLQPPPTISYGTIGNGLGLESLVWPLDNYALAITRKGNTPVNRPQALCECTTGQAEQNSALSNWTSS
jgi:hypothetical protein